MIKENFEQTKKASWQSTSRYPGVQKLSNGLKLGTFLVPTAVHLLFFTFSTLCCPQIPRELHLYFNNQSHIGENTTSGHHKEEKEEKKFLLFARKP